MSDESQMEPASRVVAAKLRAQIHAGGIPPGGKIPSVRDLARLHAVAPMTAQHAVRLLRAEGLLITVPGRGTFVRETLESPPEPDDEGELRVMMTRLDEISDQLRLLANRITGLEAQSQAGAPQGPPQGRQSAD